MIDDESEPGSWRDALYWRRHMYNTEPADCPVCERHAQLVANAPHTIMTLQEQCDKWEAAINKLIRLVDMSVGDLEEAGFQVSVHIED